MTVLHKAYLFNSEGFRDEIRSYIHDVDQGSLELLFDRATSQIKLLRTGETRWILEDEFGNPLRDIPSNMSRIKPETIGYCILIILSGHLRVCPDSILGYWPFLFSGLSRIGWDELEISKLIFGWSTSSLIQHDAEPQLISNLDEAPINSSHYSNWIRPGYGRSGWMDRPSIKHFGLLLDGLRDNLAQLNPETLGRDVFPTLTSPESTKDLLLAYDSCVKTLGYAHNSDSDLFFMII